eukprot:NODE_441_length_7368_cov_0.136195.p5 type:complete len:119 gc:universal NODE_441_length_7368_cov_0.136195:907-551(-)
MQGIVESWVTLRAFTLCTLEKRSLTDPPASSSLGRVLWCFDLIVGQSLARCLFSGSLHKKHSPSSRHICLSSGDNRRMVVFIKFLNFPSGLASVLGLPPWFFFTVPPATSSSKGSLYS